MQPKRKEKVMWMIAAAALAALAYAMDTRAVKIKARHRIDCTAHGHSLVILPDGRHMGIGVTSLKTTSAVNEADRVYIEGYLLTRRGQHLLSGKAVRSSRKVASIASKIPSEEAKKSHGFSAGFEIELEGGKRHKVGTVQNC